VASMQWSDRQVDVMLSRFPGPATLYPSRTKWLLVLLAGGLLAVGGYLMVSDGDRRGWFVLVFFASVFIVAAMMLLPGAGGLTLDRNGFQVTSLFRSSSSRWQDVSGFEPASIPPSLQKLVVYDDVNVAGRKIANLMSRSSAAMPHCLTPMGSRPTTSLGS
jgi:hypothetical protein